MNRALPEQNLSRFRELNGYDVAEDDPNPIGWSVTTDEGQTIGTVEDMLVDTTTYKVRYFDVGLDRALATESGDEGHAYLPAESARVSRSERQVTVPASSIGHLGLLSGSAASAAASSAQPVDYAPDRAVRSDTANEGETARVTVAAEELRIGKRRVQAGEVVVTKTVETEHARESVTREVERVHVERRAVDGSTPTEARIEGDEIRIPVYEEEVVVEKRPVVKEEIVIHKEVAQETEAVDAELRRERVEIEGEGIVESDRVPDPRKRDR